MDIRYVLQSFHIKLVILLDIARVSDLPVSTQETQFCWRQTRLIVRQIREMGAW